MAKKDVRLKSTENEKIAREITGFDGVNFNMSEGNVQDIIAKEKARKFNNELEKISEAMSEHKAAMEANAEKLADIENVEIKPMFSRILIKPFDKNPFQKMKIENGIVVDAGGFRLDRQNPRNGEMEQPKDFIITGVVVEIGPDVKYLREGDVVYYRRDTAAPVPFLGQNLWSIAENQIITVVNMGLEERFNSIKNG